MNTTTKDTRLHPIFPRFFALIIDLIILGISCAFLSKLIVTHTNLHPMIINLIGSAYCLTYFAMFNSTIGSGKTIGKMLCKIRVSNASSQEIGIAQSFLRSAIFILPLCFIGYLKSYAQFSVTWTMLQAFLICIVIACLYLALFNTNSQQSLHDWLTRCQILRNNQSHLEIKPIWTGHFYLLAMISLGIIISSIWQITKREHKDFSNLDPDIQNITLNTHHTYMDGTESIDQILIFDLKSIKTEDKATTAKTLLNTLTKEDPNFIRQNAINKTQLNYSYQFGLINMKQTVTYDIAENYGAISLNHAGDGSSLNFGF